MLRILYNSLNGSSIRLNQRHTHTLWSIMCRIHTLCDVIQSYRIDK